MNTVELQVRAPQVRRYTAGLIIRPEQLVEAVRRAWDNVPIPADAQFKGIRIEDGTDAHVEIFYQSFADPLSHCFRVKPDILLRVLAYWMDGAIPPDAELKAINVHPFITVLRLDIQSDKFKQDGKEMPLMQFRLEDGELYTQSEGRETRHVVA